jgi:methionyl aminopeptidase
LDFILMNKLESQRIAAQINSEALKLGFEIAKPGVTLKIIDSRIEQYIIDKGGIPAFKDYKPSFATSAFPASACISVNDIMVHGLPNEYKLKDRDILTIDLGTQYNGYYVDCAETICMTDASSENEKLLLDAGIVLNQIVSVIKPGNHIRDLFNQGLRTAKLVGVYIVPEFFGHFIGQNIHEEPCIPHNYPRNWLDLPNLQNILDTELKINDTICIEPVITRNPCKPLLCEDNWGVRSDDGQISIHNEYCVLVTETGSEILC